MKLLNISIRGRAKEQKAHSGFTLIEILVVMAIVAVFAGFGLFVSMDFLRSYSFRSERNIAVAVLRKARILSMVNMDQAAHGVRIEPDQYTIFEGQTYASRIADQDQVIKVQPSIALASSPSPLDIVFNQLDAGVAASGSFIVSDGVRFSVITVNSEGRIDW